VRAAASLAAELAAAVPWRLRGQLSFERLHVQLLAIKLALLFGKHSSTRVATMRADALELLTALRQAVGLLAILGAQRAQLLLRL
jgi:hypothetical protein